MEERGIRGTPRQNSNLCNCATCDPSKDVAESLRDYHNLPLAAEPERQAVFGTITYYFDETLAINYESCSEEGLIDQSGFIGTDKKHTVRWMCIRVCAYIQVKFLVSKAI